VHRESCARIAPHWSFPQAGGSNTPDVPGALFLNEKVLDPESVELMTTGTATLPCFSTDFPAEHLGTEMDCDDVVLRPDTWRQNRDIESWMRFNDTVLHEWRMGRRACLGYRVLFHGPPGTGKTLAAALLGKATGRPVFRVDLSRAVSKCIGETEKNVAGVFDRAEGRVGSSSSTRRTHSSGSEPTSATHTTSTPTRRPPTSCSGSRPSAAS
jgi:hypothetical protein